MENLLEQFIQRWEQAFNDLPSIPLYKAQVKTTRYSEGLRYDLEKFDWQFFASGGPMKERKDELNPDFLHEYGFNTDGFPCYVKFGHNYNQVTWEGFYKYGDDFVEYVEFCVNTGVPSSLSRMEFRDGRKISLQRLIVNGRASLESFSQMPKEKIITRIRNDENSLILTVTHFEYGSEGRIDRASSIHIAPGSGQFTSYDEYGYDQNQILDTIRTFFEQGSSRLAYCRLPEGTNPEALTDSLAEALARSIAETIANKVKEQPIALLELSYRYADNFIPLLICQSKQELAAKLVNKESVFINDYYNALYVETGSFEKLFAQLEQMMAERDEVELGRRMLLKAASLLTSSKLFGIVQVTEDFAAYAIDWSIEGHSDADFEEILLACGVEMNVINSWKQTGIVTLSNR